MMKSSNDAMNNAVALISGLELSYLQELQTTLFTEIIKREKETKREAMTKIMNVAASAGIPLEELIKAFEERVKAQSKLPKKFTRAASGPAPIKYRHPEDSKLEWSGRGRYPQWVRDWNDTHGSIDALLVP